MSRKRPHRKDQRHPAPTGNAARVIDVAPSSQQTISHSTNSLPLVLPRIARRPWDNATEWTRGKLELFWETRLSPFGQWLFAIPIRLFGGRNRTVRLARAGWLGAGRRARLGLAWSWEDQGVGMLKQLTRALLAITVSAAVLVVLIAAAVRIANAVERITPPNLGQASSTQPTAIPAITIHEGSANNGAVGQMPTYTLGLWPGNSTPGQGQDVNIYARLSDQSLPVPGIAVTISVGGQAFTAITNQDGIATFSIKATGNGPVTVTGTASVGDQTITAQTSFNVV